MACAQLSAVGRRNYLRIKAFYGSENAVKTQIWIAVSIYVLVAIRITAFFSAFNLL